MAIDPDFRLLVSIHPKVVDREDVLRQLVDRLVEAQYVLPAYAQAILDREREYPTGVKLAGPINVALAHAAPEPQNQNCMIVAVLARPVVFHLTNDPKHTVPVQIVFMLAARDYTSINHHVGKLVEEVLMKTDVIGWMAGNTDAEAIREFFDQRVFGLASG